MKYLVQIDGTAPKNWRAIDASNKEAAIIIAIRPMIAEGHNPETAYVAYGDSRHPNGAPICVGAHKLHIERDSILGIVAQARTEEAQPNE